MKLLIASPFAPHILDVLASNLLASVHPAAFPIHKNLCMLIRTETPLSRRQHTRPHMPRNSAVVVIVCLFLVALLAVIQVVHVHAHESDADHCPLCVVMHSVAPVSVAVAAVILVEMGAPAPTPKVRVVQRVWHPTLFIRPPPSPLLLPYAL